MFHICRTTRRHFSLHQVKLCIGQRKYKQKFTTQGRKEWPTDRPSEWIRARSLNAYFAYFCKIVVKRQWEQKITHLLATSSKITITILIITDPAQYTQYILDLWTIRKVTFINNHLYYLQNVESVAEPVEKSNQEIQGHVMDECGAEGNMETKGKRVSLCLFEEWAFISYRPVSTPFLRSQLEHKEVEFRYSVPVQ